jgi:hypothetical protein
MADGIGLNSPEIERIAAGTSSGASELTRAIAQRVEIAGRAGLPPGAIRFLTGDDEASLAESADSLAGWLTTSSAAKPRMVIRGEGSHPATYRSGSDLEDGLRKALNLPSAW